MSEALNAGRSVSEFVLESAFARAEETLADRRSFTLDDEQSGAFVAALDAPPQELPRLFRKRAFLKKLSTIRICQLIFFVMFWLHGQRKKSFLMKSEIPQMPHDVELDLYLWASTERVVESQT